MIYKLDREQAIEICRVMASSPKVWTEHLAGEWLGCSDSAIDLAIEEGSWP